MTDDATMRRLEKLFKIAVEIEQVGVGLAIVKYMVKVGETDIAELLRTKAEIQKEMLNKI